MAEGMIVLHVTHRSNPYEVELSLDATVADFQAQLENLTGVPPHIQKLLYKGKKAVSPEDSVQSAGLSNGLKVTLLGNPEKAIEGLLAAEKEQKRREEIMKARATKARPQVRRTSNVYSRTNERRNRFEILDLQSPQQTTSFIAYSHCNIYRVPSARWTF
jgi:Ubiquitin family